MRIYLDNNATTPVLPAVLEAMLPYFADTFGNPSSSHTEGRRARKALEDARETVARLLDAQPDEVIFTSGATEANNLALFGLAGSPPGLIVTSPIEHPCVIEPVQRLGEMGFSTHFLGVDAEGIVRWEPSVICNAQLVSVMLANHETGAVQPVGEMACATPVVHCDAVAAVGKIPVSFRKLGVAAMSVSAHKLHGPKGIGALLLRRPGKLRPQLHGGHQQQGRRPGTETVALAVGMAKALEIAVADMDRNLQHVRRLREQFLAVLGQNCECHFNGPTDPDKIVPHTINVSFPGCRADTLLIALDLAGISCSTGSACSSGSLLPSPVLKAMGLPPTLLASAMRFSLSPQLTAEEAAEAARRISFSVHQLRQPSAD